MRASGIKRLLGRPHQVFSNYLFDPWDMLKRWRGIIHFVRHGFVYSHRNTSGQFPISFRNLYYRSYDRYAPAGAVPVHYFLQDIWAARYAHDRKFAHIVDIGSRLDGYIAHLLAFCAVTYVDIRPLTTRISNLEFVGGSITALPFADGSLSCITSLHVFEHIGLGRYGDPVDPEGPVKAAREIRRVLKPGGTLIISTVVGRERLCFDAHRIFDPTTVHSMFPDLTLESFALIDDIGDKVAENATFAAAAACTYGCGIFVYKRPEH